MGSISIYAAERLPFIDISLCFARSFITAFSMKTSRAPHSLIGRAGAIVTFQRDTRFDAYRPQGLH